MIPTFFDTPNKIDESLAQQFGRFPVLFRGVLGAPISQIRILEIGILKGLLEKILEIIKLEK